MQPSNRMLEAVLACWLLASIPQEVVHIASGFMVRKQALKQHET